MNKIIVRQYRLSDAPQLARLFRHPKILKNIRGRVARYTITDAKKFIRECLQQYTQPKRRRTDYAVDRGGDVIGGVSVSITGASAEIGYWLGLPYWGQGIMTRVIKRFIADIHRKNGATLFKAKIFSFNQASGRVLEKNGFQKVALVIRDEKIGRKWFDHIYYEKELR